MAANNKRNPDFGTRRLVNEDDVFNHNAWDDVEWSEEMEHEAQSVVSLNSLDKMPVEKGDQRRLIFDAGCGVGNTTLPILKQLMRFQSVINHLVAYLKPGGCLLFRDYGLYDMAQLRFKKGKCISDNFYARSDGTRVYFFTSEELDTLFTGAGLEKIENKLDRRLIVNRKKQMKMYRVWVQCKYRKKTEQD